MSPFVVRPSAPGTVSIRSQMMITNERRPSRYSRAIERRCVMTTLFSLTGKTALVTGGNGGIGLGIARGLAQAGARVAIIARNTDKSNAAARVLAEETGVAPLVL